MRLLGNATDSSNKVLLSRKLYAVLQICIDVRGTVVRMKRIVALVFILLFSSSLFASADCECKGVATVINVKGEFVTLSIGESLSCEGYACGIKKNEQVKIYFSSSAPRLKYIVPEAGWLAEEQLGSKVDFIYTLIGDYGNVKYGWKFGDGAQ